MSKVKPAALPPDTMIGGYRIIRKVAAGGFGVVYLALDPEGRGGLDFGLTWVPETFK